jgi:hypothetical protein
MASQTNHRMRVSPRVLAPALIALGGGIAECVAWACRASAVSSAAAERVL